MNQVNVDSADQAGERAQALETTVSPTSVRVSSVPVCGSLNPNADQVEDQHDGQRAVREEPYETRRKEKSADTGKLPKDDWSDRKGHAQPNRSGPRSLPQHHAE
jgi:hypothetical protein